MIMMKQMETGLEPPAEKLKLINPCNKKIEKS